MDELLKVQQKKKKILLLFLALIILTALIFGGYFYKIQTKQAREQESLTATGTLEATRVMASFKVAGRMDALLVDEGARVKKGALLATLEPKELQAKLSQAKGPMKQLWPPASRPQKRFLSPISRWKPPLPNARPRWSRPQSNFAAPSSFMTAW